MESMYLQGSEEVGRAARSIASSADDMLRAASQIQSAVDQHAHILQTFADRMEAMQTDPEQLRNCYISRLADEPAPKAKWTLGQEIAMSLVVLVALITLGFFVLYR